MINAEEKNTPGKDNRKCQGGSRIKVIILARAPEKALVTHLSVG